VVRLKREIKEALYPFILTSVIIISIFSLILNFVVIDKNHQLVDKVNTPVINISSSSSINESKIKVYESSVELDIQNASWFGFADTNSMLPMFDSGHHGIGVNVSSVDDVHIGDVIIYKTINSSIIHRVINISEDVNGTFFTLKGDNNHNIDPTKVRIEDIEYKLVGVIY
jgi:hypothetical protein